MVMKFEGEWDELSAKICLWGQFWHFEQSKEIKLDYTGLENFDICVYLIFDF